MSEGTMMTFKEYVDSHHPSSYSAVPPTSAIYATSRPEAVKRYDAEVLARVKRGIALLEEQYGPSWVEKIDMKTLDLEDGSCCILGQVYADATLTPEQKRGDDSHWVACDHDDGYTKAMTILGDNVDDCNGSDYGFCAYWNEWSELQAAWEDVLTPIVSAS